MASRRPGRIPQIMLSAGCACALILAGCGGGGGGSGAAAGGAGASTAASGGGFVAQANAVCREAQTAGSSIKAPKTNAELAPFFDRALAVGQKEVDKLSALHPPSDKQAAYETLLKGLDQAVYFLTSADAEAKAGSLKQVETSIQEGSALTQRNLANAKAAGLSACANAN